MSECIETNELMNYRHAFHAGNHTEVFKHAVLSIVLDMLRLKPRPFAVIDTHAGLGVYDLTSREAARTNERAEGVERLGNRGLRSAPVYTSSLASTRAGAENLYPGSPEITRLALRGYDRLILCELHPEDGESLRRRYRSDPRVSVHLRDGYEAIGALLPPAERRGLVFVDPPFEKTDETGAIGRALVKGFRRWATGIYMVWYPIKGSENGMKIEAAAIEAGFNDVLRAEFCPFVRSGLELAGSGLVICNPPWTLDRKLRQLCEELSTILGHGDVTWSVRLAFDEGRGEQS
ncbi:23S rRNA (adenine(2030)-N(6))-methyltransferase RlmJ [Aurantimonas sp. VKM B-3413]|uniref:23S rRNA (adenine(2030)-N(6))-methyltransferase RlmJ n=1 Tax=Aurantimonas sp. VKM B-3413 TaxID=2779401 RepID=UPI001E3758C3|nr:23S rRNA (adenine(2030)-N(6))-methyltransferase RlmJ [Aurantimonas sp. VKM B-3413]MCB8839496.1 23S rRNA (adenine(2030)-N(6))-methyltransferase RlmJ [Aurantimonas sp. VKM B-3413]